MVNKTVSVVKNFIKYLLSGFLICCGGVYHILLGFIYIWKYAYLGILAIVRAIQLGISFLYDHTLRKLVMAFTSRQQILHSKKDKKNRELDARRRDRENLKEAARLHNLAAIEDIKERSGDVETYDLDPTSLFDDINEGTRMDAVIQKDGKRTIADRLDQFFLSIEALIEKIKKRFRSEKSEQKRALKNAEKQKALLEELEHEIITGGDQKTLYEYVAKNEDGKIVKGYFDAFSKTEVHNFLVSQGFDVYSIRSNQWITTIHGESGFGATTIKIKDLIFFCAQLSTYIKAGIPLVDSLKILTRQYKHTGYQKVFRTMIYDLSMGDSFSTALKKQGNAFPNLFINMVKSSEMTGELPEVLDDMETYYTQIEKTRKQMINALLYPCMVLFVAVVVIAFVMIYVIPQFVEIYESMDASKIPAFTLWILDCSYFLRDNGLWILLGFVIFMLIFIYLYRNVKTFRKAMQRMLMKMPVLGNVVIYNEVTLFSKTFGSLMAHGVLITDSMDILNRITSNEIYKGLIRETIRNLASGDRISESFKDHWAFPVPAYEMLVTGEKTGELPEMMHKVANYYQELHETAVTRIKTFIEPILIIILTVIVGVIVLAIVIPMFNMYSAIQE